MKLLDEDCGCDDNYFSVINNSPLLNGEQEATFDPMNNSNNLNNLIINDALDLPSPKKENSGNPIVFGRAKNNNKGNKINGNNIEMNNIKLNDTSMNNSMNNMNNAMNNNIHVTTNAAANAPTNATTNATNAAANEQFYE